MDTLYPWRLNWISLNTSLSPCQGWMACVKGSPDSSIGIATSYTLDDQAIRVRVPTRWRSIPFPSPPDHFWRPPSLLSNGYRGLFLGAKWPGREAKTYLQLPPRSRKRGSIHPLPLPSRSRKRGFIHPLPHTSSRRSVLSVEHRDNFT
jgi:hypothetical protein